MEMDIKTEEIRQIIFGDNKQFSYTRKQVEIKNILPSATLQDLDETYHQHIRKINHDLK